MATTDAKDQRNTSFRITGSIADRADRLARVVSKGITISRSYVIREAIDRGLAQLEAEASAPARRAPTHDESPALRAKIGAAIGVEPKNVYLWWDEPFLRGISLAEVEQMGSRGLSAPQIVALRSVGLVPGETGWEVVGEL